MKENSIEYRLSGRYALFTDPVTKIGGEKSTYHIPTYEAIKGITQSIYWKPTIVWIIDKIRVIHKISTESKNVKPISFSGGANDLSVYTYLRDVEYQVKAHFEWNMQRSDLEKDRNENKHFDMARRALEKGGRRDIFLGARECQGYVEPCVFGEGEGFYDEEELFSYGLMFHGFDYPSEKATQKLVARFWNAKMDKGVIIFPRPENCSVTREVRNYKATNPNVNVEATQ
ncbi:MAG: type I-C CRISPR-associated protein Cas5c [Treponema sp.]|nr:type I-C CRISPR-associated protein Cas5c [Treponema sp.]